MSPGDSIRPREVEMFLSAVDADVRRVAWLLSAAVALKPDDARRLADELWPALDSASALERLGTWPFVERGNDGWHLATAFSTSLSEDYLTSEPNSSRRAHELLAALESSRREALGDIGDMRWFTEGRIAFYEAGFDTLSAVRRFGEVFARPPSVEVETAWRWLTSLVLRQDWRLAEQARALAFFRGYEAFHELRLESAIDHLEVVVAGGASDAYKALALYFAGISKGPPAEDTIQDSLRHLEESVSLSEHLGLARLEIEARHSFVSNLMSSPSIGPVPEDRKLEVLARVSQQARLNLERAIEFGSALLRARGAWLSARADWLHLLESVRQRRVSPSRLGPEAREAVRRLATIRSELVAAGDARAAMLASKDAAAILGLLGETAAAVNEIGRAVEMTRLVQAPGTVSRLGDELRRLEADASPAERERIAALRTEINAVVGASS